MITTQESFFRSAVRAALLALVALAAFGCAQNGGGGGQASGDPKRTTVEEGAETEQTIPGGRITTAEDTAQGKAQGTAQVDKARTRQTKEVELETVTVHISGAEGLSFTGNVGSGQELIQVRGKIPKEYELPVKPGAGVVNASLRKQSREEGTIEIEVLREGQILANKESSGKAGVVNLVWSAGEKGKG